jgi:16S rRNA (adenine(1408)-N(1))-methyltransferase
MDQAEVARWCERYQEVTVDLGAGDGRFVRHLAQADPRCGAIAVDLCGENLRRAARRTGGNALFVVAGALTLPAELGGIATRVTINFPWGSLLRGLLTGDRGLVDGLQALCRGEAVLNIVLNAGALADVGWTLETGAEQVTACLPDAGSDVAAIDVLGPAELKALPTTWAKRLAFGRDPRAMTIGYRLPAIGYRLSATGYRLSIGSRKSEGRCMGDSRGNANRPIADSR